MRTATMKRTLLSEILDGAASPAIMLAVAVSQFNIGPNQKDTLHQRGQLTVELKMSDRVQQKATNARGH
jgi:hypothetical protein